MTPRTSLAIDYFSDVLCVWAYCGQIRIDELCRAFGDRIAIRYRFLSVFGNTPRKIGAGWAERGGFEGYAAHVSSVAARFPHVSAHAEAWARVRPASSSAAHLFLKAVQLSEDSAAPAASGLLEKAIWATRCAFFGEARDVATRPVQMEIAEQLGLSRSPIEAALDDGRAFAALCEDNEAQLTQKIEGSPTLVFNEGRQKLYGNVGYRIIQANIEELLRTPDAQTGSWC